MNLVVDTNELKGERLRNFLSKSKANKAVLIDYCAMEIYSPGSSNAVWDNMRVLREFDEQVLVLKGTMAVCAQRGRRANLHRRLIDLEQTKNFPKYILALKAAVEGSLFHRQQLSEHVRNARYQLERIIPDAVSVVSVIPELAGVYTAAEKEKIRSHDFSCAALCGKVIENAIGISAEVFSTHPAIYWRPKYGELPYTFVFRLVLATYLLSISRGSHGLALGIKSEKVRNDMIDMYFVAYGTLFDGVLSSDRRLFQIYKDMQCLLSVML